MKAWYARRRHWIVPLAWVLGAWVAWWLFFGAPERARNRAINPAVFQAFRYIEGHCAREVFPNETVRCQAALRAMAECTAKDPACSAGDYHAELFAAGFTLPALYLGAQAR